jgi:imidazoleglycerol-phosphate dehydratase
MRTAEIRRTTKETDIYIKTNLDGEGKTVIDCQIGFLRHMLEAFAKHGLFDISVQASGDIDVDQHHLVEDAGIVLGRCFADALGEKRGIKRCGFCFFPMDETLARVAVDISGRAFLVFNAAISGLPLVSGNYSFQTDTVEDFWRAFAASAGITLHIDVLRGRSDHHKIEAVFKAAGRALRDAVEIDPRSQNALPSTKGLLDRPTVMV